MEAISALPARYRKFAYCYPEKKRSVGSFNYLGRGRDGVVFRRDDNGNSVVVKIGTPEQIYYEESAYRSLIQHPDVRIIRFDLEEGGVVWLQGATVGSQLDLKLEEDRIGALEALKKFHAVGAVHGDARWVNCVKLEDGDSDNSGVKAYLWIDFRETRFVPGFTVLDGLEDEETLRRSWPNSDESSK